MKSSVVTPIGIFAWRSAGPRIVTLLRPAQRITDHIPIPYETEELFNTLLEVAPHAKGVYVTLNELDPALLARRKNQVAASTSSASTTATSKSSSTRLPTRAA